MGQQQLLLVILVTIIVGIATVVAITTMGTSADSANIEAVRQDVAKLASAAQGYYRKPAMLGGGGSSFNHIHFRNIAFSPGGLDHTTDEPMTAWNENGKYVISIFGGGETITITAHPSSRIAGTVEDSIEPADATETLAVRVEPDNFCWGEIAAPVSCED